MGRCAEAYGWRSWQSSHFLCASSLAPAWFLEQGAHHSTLPSDNMPNCGRFRRQSTHLLAEGAGARTVLSPWSTSLDTSCMPLMTARSRTSRFTIRCPGVSGALAAAPGGLGAAQSLAACTDRRLASARPRLWCSICIFIAA